MPDITLEDLKILEKERLEDAKALFKEKRYGGAVYICGYAVELGLKKKICQTLGWDKYPTDKKYSNLKTHDLEVLLHFSGVEKFISINFKAEWSGVLQWDPETRYSAVSVTEAEARSMIESTEELLRVL